MDPGSALDTLAARAGWARHPFGRLVARSKEAGRPDLQPLSVFLGQGVVPRSSREDNHNRLGDDMSKYLVVRPNDIVFNKLRTWQGGFGVSRYEGVVSPAYFVCRPGSRLDPRYLHHLLRSLPYLAELTRLSKFMPPSQFDIIWDDLRLLPVVLPPPPIQRAIADYLDTETTRIDSIIARRRRMVELFDERRAGIIESTIRELVERWGERGLRFVAPEVLVGIVVTPAAFYADEGVLALRGMNVKPGRLDLADTVTLSAEGHALHQKSTLRAGDLVVVRTGQAGAACVVPPALDGANCIDLLIVRRSSLLDPLFLEYVLNSDWARKHIEEHSVGTIQSHFNVGALKQLPVPVPPIEIQSQAARDLANAVARVDALQQMTERQIELLVEHRQALITAAVTGELKIPGVAA